MKIAAQEGPVPGETVGEKLVNLEAYGFDGVELIPRDGPGPSQQVCQYPPELTLCYSLARSVFAGRMRPSQGAEGVADV